MIYQGKVMVLMSPASEPERAEAKLSFILLIKF